MHLVTFTNDGQAIVATNYFDSEHARRGLMYLSWNAGAARLLVPDSVLPLLSEMQTGNYIILSRGPLVEHGHQEGLEIMFEDNSDTPFSVLIVTGQTDRLLPENEQGGGFPLSVWTRNGEVMRLPAKYRVVEALPCLLPWENH